MNESKASDGIVPAGKEPASGPQRQTEGSSLGRRALFYLAGITLIFLLGFLPMWFKVAHLEKERDAAQSALRLAQVQLALAAAAIDARRGEYEHARLSVIKFFTDVTAEMQRTAGSSIPAAQRETLQPLLAQRDELVTLLARGDPASAERLANLYVAFRQAVRK